MTFQEEIKNKIGNDIYSKLDKMSNFALGGKYSFCFDSPLGQNSFIEELLPTVIPICKLFEDKKFTISPFDVVNVLYKCKLLKSAKSKEDYKNKTLHYNLVDEFDFFIPWHKKDIEFNELTKGYFERLSSFQNNNTLITHISSYKGSNFEIQRFLDGVFHKLNFPFRAYFDDSVIKENYLKRNGEWADFDKDRANRYFSAPSIGFECYGSKLYCRWHSNIWLKSIISLLKIGGFIHPGQIEYGFNIRDASSYASNFFGHGCNGMLHLE